MTASEAGPTWFRSLSNGLVMRLVGEDQNADP